MKMMPAYIRPTQKPEKQQIPIIVFSFDPATTRTHDLHIRGVHASHYTADEFASLYLIINGF